MFGYEFSYAMDEALGMGLLTGLISGTPSFLLSVAMYVFSALALYAIAKRRGINHPWLSWVPVANVWILGSVSDQYRYVVRGEYKSKRKVLLTLNILMALFVAAIVSLVAFTAFQAFQVTMAGAPVRTMLNRIMAPLLGVAGVTVPLAGLGIAYAIFRFMALYDLYTSCEPQNNVLFLVLSVLFPVTEAFFLFFIRNKDQGMPPRRQDPQYIPEEYTQQPQWQESENHEYL